MSTVITKTLTFNASHMLENHKGLCQNLHGHTYKVEVSLSGKPTDDVDSPELGMVKDFRSIKEKVEFLISKLDHAFLYNCNGKKQAEISKTLQKLNLKQFEFCEETTCENLAKFLFHKLNDMGLKVCQVRLYETPTSFAVYS